MNRLIYCVALCLGFSLSTAHAKSKIKSDWIRDLPALDPQGDASGRWARVIAHAHSVESHDACDKKPKDKKGNINLKCLQSFRAALCRDHVDAVFLTEHKKSMAFTAFNEVLHPQPGDEPVIEGGSVVANRFSCPDGHQVLELPGAENALMPLGLKRHPDATPGDPYNGYSGFDGAAAANFRAAGALVAKAHLEDSTMEELELASPDVVESYNVHANLLELKNDFHLGQTLKKIGQALKFLVSSKAEPDLMFLIFFHENADTHAKWAKLQLREEIGNGVVPAIVASDAHENTLKIKLRDKERVDGYRRVFRWFSNHVLVPSGPITRDALVSSLKDGRFNGVFEIFGTPRGFEFSNTGAEFRLNIPAAPTGATVKGRILKATHAGWVLVAERRGGNGPLLLQAQEPGVYRAEVRIDPGHLRKFLPGSLGKLIREYPWVYSNPVRYIK